MSPVFGENLHRNGKFVTRPNSIIELTVLTAEFVFFAVCFTWNVSFICITIIIIIIINCCLVIFASIVISEFVLGRTTNSLPFAEPDQDSMDGDPYPFASSPFEGRVWYPGWAIRQTNLEYRNMRPTKSVTSSLSFRPAQPPHHGTSFKAVDRSVRTWISFGTIFDTNCFPQFLEISRYPPNTSFS